MRNAMDEIERRRTKQILFNQQHHIVPRSVNKQIKDMIDGIYAPENTSQNLQIAQTEARYSSMDESQLAKEIQLLEKNMLVAAKNPELEQATHTPEIRQLKNKPFIGTTALPGEEIVNTGSMPALTKKGKKSQKALIFRLICPP